MNDRIENSNFFPYHLPGRWYKIFVESDGSEFKITTSDIEDAHMSATTLIMPPHFHIMSFMVDANTEGGSDAASTLNLVLKKYANGDQGINIGSYSGYDWANIYVYGYISK